MAELTERQQKAIPFIVGASTYTKGLTEAQVSRKTFYAWIKVPEFKQELVRQREQVAEAALGVLEQNLTRAVEALAGLLDTEDERLRRQAANDIIEHFLNYRQTKNLAERLEALERGIADTDMR